MKRRDGRKTGTRPGVGVRVAAAGIVLAAAGFITAAVFTRRGASGGMAAMYAAFTALLAAALTLWLQQRRQKRRERRTFEMLLESGGALLVTGDEGITGEDFDAELLERILGVMRSYLELGSTREIVRTQTNLVALQNQINPHFLYNTLDVIRSEAMIEGAEHASKMIETLSRLFRYGISGREDLVTLEDELRNISDYFYIQQCRFLDRFALKVEIDIDVKSEDCRIPKLTLQPLVENAILHAFPDRSHGGVITISAENLEKQVKITVSDNGVGMTREALRKMRERLRDSGVNAYRKLGNDTEGIALENIHKRLRLSFGEKYGLYVYSMQGMGTDIIITIPNCQTEA